MPLKTACAAVQRESKTLFQATRPGPFSNHHHYFDGYYSSLVLSEQSVLVPINKRPKKIRSRLPNLMFIFLKIQVHIVYITSLVYLMMDRRVPKIGFSGTRNQPKNGVKAS